MATPVPSLKIVAGANGAAGRVVDIPSGFDQIVGRDATADITVVDPAISRRHARLYRDADGVWLEDLESTNGTYINGDRLTVPYRLRDGDEVKLGNSLATFQDAGGESDATEVISSMGDAVDGAAPIVAPLTPAPAPAPGATAGVAPELPAPVGAGVSVPPAPPEVATAAVGRRTSPSPEAGAAAPAGAGLAAPARTPIPTPAPTPPGGVAAPAWAHPAPAPATPASPAPPGADPTPVAPDPGPAADWAQPTPALSGTAPDTGVVCPDCAATNRSDAYFCRRCGSQRRPISSVTVDPGPAPLTGGRNRLTTTHGEIRRQEFGQAMRARNGGRRVPYNESLAIPTLVFRGFMVLLLIAVIVEGLVILSEGVHRALGL